MAAKQGTGQANKVPADNFCLTVREEDGKVYANAEEFQSLYGDDSAKLYEQIGDEVLIYDFTLKEGSSFGSSDVVVERIDTMKTNDGIDRKLFVLSTGHKILEGIGCLYSEGKLMNYLGYSPVEETSIGWRYTFLRSFVKNGEIIYGIDSTDADRLIATIKSQQTGMSVTQVYDLQGRLISEKGRVNSGQLPRGVYIRNGRKFVVK